MRKRFIDAADNFFPGFCLVQICRKLVTIRSTGGNFDFKLILQIENVSSTKQSCQVTNIGMFSAPLGTAALPLTLRFSQPWISDGLVCHLEASSASSACFIMTKLCIWQGGILGQKWGFGSFKVKHHCVIYISALGSGV